MAILAPSAFRPRITRCSGESCGAEVLVACLTVCGRPLTAAVVYIAPDQRLSDAAAAELRSLSSSVDLFGGDVNAQAAPWGLSVPIHGAKRSRAQAVEAALACSGLLPVPSPPTRGDRTLDVLAAAPHLAVVPLHIMETLGSDHRPVGATLTPLPQPRKKKWLWGRCDWGTWRRTAERRAEELAIRGWDRPWSAEQANQAVLSVLAAARKAAVPHKRPPRPHPATLRARRRAQVHTSQLDIAGSARKAEPLERKIVACMEGRPHRPPQPLHLLGDSLAASLASHWAANSAHVHETAAPDAEPLPPGELRDLCSRPPSAGELDLALVALKRAEGKAAGQDGVSADELRAAGPQLRRLLLQLLSTCWETSSVPGAWRSAVRPDRQTGTRRIASAQLAADLPHLGRQQAPGAAAAAPVGAGLQPPRPLPPATGQAGGLQALAQRGEAPRRAGLVLPARRTARERGPPLSRSTWLQPSTASTETPPSPYSAAEVFEARFTMCSARCFHPAPRACEQATTSRRPSSCRPASHRVRSSHRRCSVPRSTPRWTRCSDPPPPSAMPPGCLSYYCSTPTTSCFALPPRRTCGHPRARSRARHPVRGAPPAPAPPH